MQVCADAAFPPGLATCDPYLKGYGQINYTFNDGTFLSFGVDYEGKNNAYYQPPFAIADMALRIPVSRTFDFNLSVENLFITTPSIFCPSRTPAFRRLAIIKQRDGSIQGASYSTYRSPAVTQTLRLSVRAHVGR